MDLGSDGVHDSPEINLTADAVSRVNYHEIYTYDTDYPEALSRAQGRHKVVDMVEMNITSGETSSARMRSTNSDPDGDGFIIDTGAPTSCVKSLHLLHHDTFQSFPTDEQVRVLSPPSYTLSSCATWRPWTMRSSMKKRGPDAARAAAPGQYLRQH
jgi:hypothetical protein